MKIPTISDPVGSKAGEGDFTGGDVQGRGGGGVGGFPGASLFLF